MNKFSTFIEIIKDFILLFDSLNSVEQEKLDAAVKNRVSFVEDCMKKEQAAVLRLRGLEQKREAAQKELGMEGLQFRQILEKVPDDVAAELQPLFEHLSAQVRTFQSLSQNSKDIIEVNLHMIQASLASQTDGRETYSPSGNKKNDTKTHFTSRSV